jgi:hypothetical protein
MFVPTCYSYCLWNVVPFIINQVSVMISFVSVVSKHGSFENFWYQTFDVCCHCEILHANRSSDQTWMVAASWARRVVAAASPRSYRVQVHKQVCVCPHVEEVRARKWKLDAPTQDTALSAGRPLPPGRFRVLISVMVRPHYSCSCWCTPGLCSSGDSSGFYLCS